MIVFCIKLRAGVAVRVRIRVRVRLRVPNRERICMLTCGGRPLVLDSCVRVKVRCAEGQGQVAEVVHMPLRNT